MHDVQELRDLVELVPPQEAADGRVERVTRGHETRPDALLRVRHQRPELVDAERLQIAPDARAAIQHRTAARELDRDRDQHRDRQQHDQPGGGDDHLPPAVAGAVGLEPGREPRRGRGVLCRSILFSACLEGGHGTISVGMGVTRVQR